MPELEFLDLFCGGGEFFACAPVHVELHSSNAEIKLKEDVPVVLNLGDAVATVRLSAFIGTLVFLIGTPAVARAQSRADCQTARRSIGAAVGRSSPYFEPSAGVGGTSGSVLSRGGLQVAGRADLPIAGAWRARIEGAATNWRLERQIYSADLRQVIATETVGDVGVRQIVALAGRQGGRAPVCGYVLAGGGFYSLDYQGTSFRSPGAALTAGVEFPGGPRGSVQVDVQLHMINTRGRYPVGSSVVLATGLSAGWAFRF